VRRSIQQLELDRRWRERRNRGGRKPGPNPRIRHRSRVGVASRLPCHVTFKVRDGVPSLRSVSLVQEIERSFAACCERGDFRLVHYSLQGNHAHLLVEAVDRHALGRGMKALGARLARAVNRVFRRSGPVLADRYHVRVLSTPREVRNALAYVLLNARRHAAKAGRRLSRALGIDPASSGRWFDGWKAPFAPMALSSPNDNAVSPPRTWLLEIGWRRCGLLDPDEIPGR
jgi:REP element-mobilizing transposase RayT